MTKTGNEAKVLDLTATLHLNTERNRIKKKTQPRIQTYTPHVIYVNHWNFLSKWSNGTRQQVTEHTIWQLKNDICKTAISIEIRILYHNNNSAVDHKSMWNINWIYKEKLQCMISWRDEIWGESESDKNYLRKWKIPKSVPLN